MYAFLFCLLFSERRFGSTMVCLACFFFDMKHSIVKPYQNFRFCQIYTMIFFMISIFNTYFKDTLPINRALTRYAGIGKEMAKQTCDELGVSGKISFQQFNSFQLKKLREILHQNYLIGSALQTFIKKRKKRLSSMSAYRGFRHLQGLPCRGQRTHGNARTSRKQ